VTFISIMTPCYNEEGNVEELFVLPAAAGGSDRSWFGFLLTVRPGAPFSRDDIVAELESKRIQTRMLFAGWWT
jgi:CDP-6-deoxy-D-xylo-4-hexulose-3-dehydrase